MKFGKIIAWLPVSLQGRLMVLVLMAVLPALALVVSNAWVQRKAGLATAEQETLRWVRLAGEEHDRLIESARQLMLTLAQLKELQNRDAAYCRRLFAGLLRIYGIYANVSAATPDGVVFASGRPGYQGEQAGHLHFFQQATNRLEFVLGPYRIDEGASVAIMNLGYPVMSENRQLSAVVIISMDLSWLVGMHSQASLPPGSSFTAYDKHRITLARYPDPEGTFVGQALPSSSGRREPATNAAPISLEEGSRIITGRDGVRRLYGYAPLGKSMGTETVRLSMGIPLSFAHETADRMLKRNLAFLGVVAMLALIAAWMGGQVLFIRTFQKLLGVTQRLEGGDLSSRYGPHDDPGELGQLTRAFDRMSAALEKQFGDRARAEEALRVLNRELENRVEERTKELKRSNEDLEQFAYVASHDLQEPLRMVTSYLNLIEQRYGDKLGQDAKEFIDFAVDGAERMHHLIRDLLAYSRVQTRARPFQEVPCGLLVSQVLDNLKVAVEESGARVECGTLPSVQGDPSQLSQLFQNLLSNAIKFRGSAPPLIQIEAREERGEWVFTVRDNGIGIPAKHFERIFIIFQRLHGRDKYAGTGIGLSICKKIVERHGGRIGLESTEGVGSTFWFTIPVRREQEGNVP